MERSIQWCPSGSVLFHEILPVYSSTFLFPNQIISFMATLSWKYITIFLFLQRLPAKSVHRVSEKTLDLGFWTTLRLPIFGDSWKHSMCTVHTNLSELRVECYYLKMKCPLELMFCSLCPQLRWQDLARERRSLGTDLWRLHTALGLFFYCFLSTTRWAACVTCSCWMIFRFIQAYLN